VNKQIIGIIVFCLCFLVIPYVHAEENKLIELDAMQLQSLIDSNKGKVIFINFFATWCPPCREEIPALIALAKDYKNSEVMFVGLSVDKDIELVKPFIEKMGIIYPVYLASNEVASTYGVRSVPHNAIYDDKGVLVANAPGYSQKADIKRFIDNILKDKK